MKMKKTCLYWYKSRGREVPTPYYILYRASQVACCGSSGVTGVTGVQTLHDILVCILFQCLIALDILSPLSFPSSFILHPCKIIWSKKNARLKVAIWSGKLHRTAVLCRWLYAFSVSEQCSKELKAMLLHPHYSALRTLLHWVERDGTLSFGVQH